MSKDPALQTLIVESRELLQNMEDSLLQIENETDQTESINAIFRAAHTIKGSAGLFGLEHIVGFTHVVESVLDKVRNGQLSIDGNMIALLLSCGDHIATMIDHLDDGSEMSLESRVEGEGLVQRLVSAYLQDDPHYKKQQSANVSQKASPNLNVTTRVEPQAELQLDNPNNNTLSNDHWHISLRFGLCVLRNGMDPLSFFRYLSTLGEIISITTLYDAIPAADQMDPEACYMGYEIKFNSKADKAAIEGVFEFVRDDCKIYILPPHSQASDFVNMIKGMPDDEVNRLGEILIKSGTLTRRELDELLNIQAQDSQPRQLGEIAVEQGMVQPGVVAAALDKQKQAKESKTKSQQLVRVDAEKLDLLVTLIGELVISGASINLISQRHNLPDMAEAASLMNRLVEEVRDQALNLRMVQIGETFNRFQRVVRDVSKELGKDIELVISGGETELDKMVVDKIGDPLTHLVRNSIDHGIETSDIRVQHGKSAKGTVNLNAFHDSGSIVIEVSDDGGGLNKDKILAKAIEKGIVSPTQNLSEKEIFNLIFEAGFSTADKISNISGRGVGMDVVRRNIEALRGTVEIDSAYTVGTTMRIRLPLTLAIIDGFLVTVGHSSFVIPLDMVVECIDLSDADKDALSERSYINLRGEVLPVVPLRGLFDIHNTNQGRQSIVVVQYGSMRAGLVVDVLMGEFQTVIKPLGKLFEKMKGIGGSTILGNGEVALILDVPNLVQMVAHSEHVPTKVAA